MVASLPRPEVRVQGAGVPEADGLAEEIGVGLREHDHLVPRPATASPWRAGAAS